MRMPIEASALDQMPSAMPSQVGSLVFVMLLSSIVLNIEHIVALINQSVSRVSMFVLNRCLDIRDTEQKDDADAHLRALVQLHSRDVNERRGHVNDICDDVADALCIG